MRVLIVSAVFPPEPMVSASTSAQIATQLTAQGHEVHVLAPWPNRPAGKVYAGYRRRLLPRRRSTNGYTLAYCFSTLAPRSSLAQRFLENISFGLSSAAAALFTRRPDVIYSNSWPIFATGLIWLVARLRGIPLVISVQDVYPESLTAQGRSAQGLLLRAMRRLDSLITRNTAHVIVISQHFADLYRTDRGVAADRVSVVPNWAESTSIDMTLEPLAWRRQQGIEDDALLLVYGGNIGVAAGVETVIEALAQVPAMTDLRLVIAGEGSRLQANRDLAQQLGEQRVLFHTPWAKAETSAVLRAADVLVLPTRGSQSVASVPSKLISYLLTARPVLALVLPESEIAHIIEQSGCGWVIPPDRPDLLAAQLHKIASLDRAARADMGQAGRVYALQHLTQEACLPRVVDLILVCGSKS